MTDITLDIPEGAEPSRCRGCKSVIFWVKTSTGKNMPVNPDGTSHFSDCPDAETFRRPPLEAEAKEQKNMLMRLGTPHIRANLSDWELGFCADIAGRIRTKRALTPKQVAKLTDIYENNN